MRAMTGVKPKMIEVHVPRLVPTLSTMDMLTIEKWYVAEHDIVQLGDLLVSLEAPPGFFDIPTPPNVTGPCRVKQILVAQGEQIRLGELLIRLEPVLLE
jgi:multidrug efflux pump subunit AcrA (membrane-fusion protein)